MNLIQVSIRRPVFATMLIALLVVFGGVLFARLNVDMYPNINFPIVTVTVVYPGASPETMESQVSEPLEEALNSLSGIRSLRSASLESVSQVFVEFDLSQDIGAATQEVRDRIATIQAQLPAEADLPMVQKLDLGAIPILQLAVHGGDDPTALLQYAEDDLKPSLEQIGGVGQVNVIGGRDREMHVWLRPDALRAYGLTVQDVVGAIRSQNLEVPGGRVERGGQELVVRTDARAQDADALAALTLSVRGDAVLRLGDVAVVEDGHEEQRSLARIDGEPAVALVVLKQSDGNTVDVAHDVAEALPRLRQSAPPGVTLDVLVDNSKAISASIETVQLDLVLGAFLAVGIIFLFLRDWRATLISGLALPTSVIGTFGFVGAMGFTLNMMTTLALSLSIGILIDDAIVVIENIVRRRTALHEEPMLAASRGTAEIALAVLATTLCIVAVFVPVAFMDGMLGQFFYEFGLTVAFAVLLSLFVSFTLTPMLSSRFLSDHHASATGLSGAIERVLTSIDEGYRRVVRFALRRRLVTLGVAVTALVATLMLAPFIGFEMIPVADTGQFQVTLELPPGTPLSETAARTEDVAARIAAVPGVDSTFSTVGGGVQERVNTSAIVATLADKHHRGYHQLEAMAHVRQLLASEQNLVVAVGPMQAISAGGRQAAVQLDLRGDDLEALGATATRIADRLRQTEGFVDVDTTYRAGKPELQVVVDRDRAADLGVTGAQVATTVRSLVAGEVATQVENHGERYDIRVQLPEDARTVGQAGDPSQLRTASGGLVDLSTVVALDVTSGPNQIDRQARSRQISVLANVDGLALGEALDLAAEIADAEAPAGVSHAFGGSGKMLQESVSAMLLALGLAVVCVYMILAAQFESFLQPLTIMASLPFALIGAFLGLLVTGQHMTIFAMIGLIMLMGLVTKNAILLVDFANQQREAGSSIHDALETAGATRLRPILMTTAAMVFGMLPVAIGHGDGGEIRAAMGIIVIGGLLTSTVLTLVVVPVLYTFTDRVEAVVLRLAGRGAVHASEHAHADDATALAS